MSPRFSRGKQRFWRIFRSFFWGGRKAIFPLFSFRSSAPVRVSRGSHVATPMRRDVVNARLHRPRTTPFVATGLARRYVLDMKSKWLNNASRTLRRHLQLGNVLLGLHRASVV